MKDSPNLFNCCTLVPGITTPLDDDRLGTFILMLLVLLNSSNKRSDTIDHKNTSDLLSPCEIRRSLAKSVL